MKIYVFGNPLIPQDSLPLRLLPDLRRKFPLISFETVDPNENFPPIGEKELVIIDTVKGLSTPRIIDLEDFTKKIPTPISPHDYDLLLHLLLLKKTGKINSAKIIGLPDIKTESLLKDLTVMIEDIYSHFTSKK